MCSRQALCRAGTHTAGHIHPTAGHAHPTARTLQGTPLHGTDPQLLPTERPSPGHSTSPPFVPWALLSQECISASYKASHKVKLPKSPKTLRIMYNHETQRRGLYSKAKPGPFYAVTNGCSSAVSHSLNNLRTGGLRAGVELGMSRQVHTLFF